MAGSEIRFGTDGWRGVMADSFTLANVRRVAEASARYMRDHPSKGPKRILVGYDRRFQSRSFAEAAARCLAQAGHAVQLSSSPLPTPAVSVCIRQIRADWGVMITASHNPALYNGFKIKDGHGRSAPPEVTEAIEKLLDSPPETAGNDNQRSVSFDFLPGYLSYLKQRLDWSLIRKFNGRVVFDHLHGVAAGIPEKLLDDTKVRAVSLHSAADPLFGGLHPEPIECNLGELQKAVKMHRAQVGIAHDGDADRLGIIDDQGRYLTPHQVFPLLILHCIEHKGWKGKIVQSISLGALGERIAAHFGFPFEEVPVGFKHVAERMIRQDILAGGEESGGYAVRGGLPERDGILSGLLFMEMLAARRKTTSQLLSDMEKRFGKARFRRVDLHLDAPVADKAQFARELASRLPGRLAGASVQETRTFDGIKVVLSDGSWVLLRPSGTEPLLRTYAESDSWARTEELLKWAKAVVSAREKVPA